MKSEKKWSLMDYYALVALSSRSYFWRVDGHGWKNLRPRGFAELMGGVMFFVIFYGIRIIFSPLFAPFLVFNVVSCLFNYGIASAIRKVVLYTLGFLLVYNPYRAKYALHYRDSAWYRNTGITPNQVRKDQGLYGEYIATMCAEQYLDYNHICGKVFNSVIIPKRDGDFNEIDIISVNEHGIHVIEAKARTGEFYGTGTSPQWTQRCGRQEYTMQNPLMQNLTHCNFLTEYLYEHLPEGVVDGFLFDKTKNIVLFILSGINSHISLSDLPSMSFVGMAESSLFHKNYRKRSFLEPDESNRLTVEQIDAISAILKQASSYSAEERQQMINDRSFKQERHMFSHPFNYYVAKLVDRYGNYTDFIAICRDNGYYKTYFLDEEKVFRAMPEISVGDRTADCPDFNKVYRAYIQYLKQHPDLTGF